MAAQSRERRPAARRRPARVLADARSRRPDGLLSSRRVRRRGRRRRHPCGTPARLARRAPGVRSMTMRTGFRVVSSAALGVAAAMLLSCGSSGAGLIPVENAGPLQSDFETVAQAAENAGGSCIATEAAILKTERDFSPLPSTVDAGLRNRLDEG